MRPSLLVTCGSIVLGAAASLAACANSDDPATPVVPDSGASVAVDDGGPTDAPDTGATNAVDAGSTKCSDSGWCRTSLPDEELTLKDIWTVAGHAFAIADSSTLGIKVLEWKDADAQWTYIDDGTQNERGFGTYAGRIWAPSENEVYYGIGPGYIYHGKRPVAPGMAWSWTRQQLKDNSHPDMVEPLDGYPYYWKLATSYPALGVWGTSATDVYAWFTNTIYHWTSVDGGAPEWVPEYVADDSSSADEHLFFLAATGTSPDGVWFSGARARTSSGCALLVRKVAGRYERIADGALTSDWSPCAARPDSLFIGGAEGWLADIQAASPDRIIGIKGARDVVKISVAPDSYSFVSAPVPSRITSKPLFSLWVSPETLWLSAHGVVARADSNDVWDGGAYQISSVALNGTPLARTILQVRGTSNANLWAIGVRHALHKTTP